MEVSFGTRVRWCAIRRLLVGRRLGVVLDIGSGKSVLSTFLAGDYLKWFNLDLCLDRQSLGVRPKQVWGIVADAQALPIRSKSVDTVFLVSVLEHFRSAQVALAEVRRVLAADGRIVLTVPREPRPFFLHHPDLAELGHERFGYGKAEILGLLEQFEIEAVGYAFHFPGQVGWELGHAFRVRYSTKLGWRVLYSLLLFWEERYRTDSIGNEVVVVARVR